MGCIQTKKLIRIDNSSPNSGSKSGSNTVAVHNIRKDPTSNEVAIVNNNNNNNNGDEKNDKNDKMIHSNSQTFKVKNAMNDAQSKSNNSKKNSSYYNRSMSNNEEKEEICLLVNNNNNNNLIDKDIKFEDKYAIENEENVDSYFQTYKIKLTDTENEEDTYRTMIKIEKEIFGEFTSDKKIAEEVSLLSQLDSRYIIKVYECFASNKRYYLITDYCQHGNLNDKLRNGSVYNENQIRYIVLQIFKAVKYLNMKNFLHIEISPEKILIEDIVKDAHGEELYNIKLLDFFCPSRNNLILDNKSSFYCYIAPEVMEQKYSPTCDIWSIGIIIFQMFFGELPYKDTSDFKEYINNIKSTYNLCDNISNEFKDLLDKMLNKNPSRRITVNECLSHPWVHKQNTEIITEEEEINKQQQLTRTKTKQSKFDKYRKKSYKSGKILNIDSKKLIYYSEHNSHKSNLIEAPLHRNSSSLVSDSNSFNYENNFKINNKNDITATNANSSKFNDSAIDKTKFSNNNIMNNLNLNKTNLNNKTKNNSHYKYELLPENFQTNRKRASIKRYSTFSVKSDKHFRVKYPPLISKTLDYIKFYICLSFKRNREIEKITKIFRELDKQNIGYLSYNQVYFAWISYRDNKKISIDSFNNFDKNYINNDKQYQLEEFINVLIKDKVNYINNNFKIVFELIRQPNIDEIIKIYKDQEPIDEYKKYVIYIKELVKTVQENTIKKNYFFNEFKDILDNSINKVYENNNLTITHDFINNYVNDLFESAKLDDSPKKPNNKYNIKIYRRCKTKKFVRSKKDKNNNGIKRSNTFLKKSAQAYENINAKMRSENKQPIDHFNSQINPINLSESKVYNLQISEFNPDLFLKLTKQ